MITITDLLLDFESYFKDKGVVTTLFRDTMPDKPDTAVATYEYQGDSGLSQVNGVLRSVQIVVRDKSATKAKEKARELYKSLSTEDGIVNLTTERWCLLTLRGTPFRLKVDASDRNYYCFNVGVVTYED